MTSSEQKQKRKDKRKWKKNIPFSPAFLPSFFLLFFSHSFSFFFCTFFPLFCYFSFSLSSLYFPDFSLLINFLILFVIVFSFSPLNFFLVSPLYQGGCYEHKGYNKRLVVSNISRTSLRHNACPPPLFLQKILGRTLRSYWAPT